MNYFKNLDFVEIKADDILSITIDKEYEFKPFDRVLTRDNDTEIWSVDIFSHIQGDEFRFVTVGSCWRYCLPFEGNEHLVGTSDSPDNV